MSELDTRFIELKELLKNKSVRANPRFYTLVKKLIHNLEQIKRLEAMNERVTAENSEISIEIDRLVKGGVNG